MHDLLVLALAYTINKSWPRNGLPLHDLYVLARTINTSWPKYTVLSRNCYFFAALFLTTLKDVYKGEQEGEPLELVEDDPEREVESGRQGTFSHITITKPSESDKDVILEEFNNMKREFYTEVTAEEVRHAEDIASKKARIAELERELAQIKSVAIPD